MFGTFFFNPVWETQSKIIVSFLKEGVYEIHFQCHHQQQGFHFTVRDITCPGNHEQSFQFSVLESSLVLLDSRHLVGATVRSNTFSFRPSTGVPLYFSSSTGLDCCYSQRNAHFPKSIQILPFQLSTSHHCPQLLLLQRSSLIASVSFFHNLQSHIC